MQTDLGSRMTRRSGTQLLAEPADEVELPLQDLLLRRLQVEPPGAVHLGELLPPAGPRRPLHREGVAADRVRVAIALERPRGDDLSARLLHHAELHELAVRHDAGLLRELAPRGVERIF